MNIWLKIIFLLCAVCNIALADDDDTPSSKTEAGQSVIMLNAKAQQTSGLQTLILKSVNYQAELTAYGKILAIQPLIALRQRYLTALTERNTAQAKFKLAERNIERQQALYREGITARRNVENQQAQWQIDKAQLEATHYQDQTIKDEALLVWGKTLSEWALSSDTNKLNALLSGQAKLLQITLPSSQALADNIKTIYFSATGNRDKAYSAKFISSAPQTDISTQGSSYFFQTKAKNINIGMNVTAWLPEQEAESIGVMIPKSALLWAMNQAFVYVKTDATHFSRRLISDYNLSADGYFVSAGLKPDEELVVTGGQMLLSEEMRGQIPDED